MIGWPLCRIWSVLPCGWSLTELINPKANLSLTNNYTEGSSTWAEIKSNSINRLVRTRITKHEDSELSSSQVGMEHPRLQVVQLSRPIVLELNPPGTVGISILWVSSCYFWIYSLRKVDAPSVVERGPREYITMNRCKNTTRKMMGTPTEGTHPGCILRFLEPSRKMWNTSEQNLLETSSKIFEFLCSCRALNIC